MESMAVSLLPFGGMIGTLCGGNVIQIGRRRMLFATNLLLSIGIILTLIRYYGCLVAGRLIIGFCLGLIGVLTPSFIREVSPVEIGGILGSLFTYLNRIGTLVSFSLGLLLPKISEPIPKNDNWWRIALGFPLVLIALQTLLMLLYFFYETPKGCLIKGDQNQCMKILKCMYRDTERIKKEVYEIEKVLNESQGKDVSYRMLFSRYFARPLIVCAILNICRQVSGYAAIIYYSTSIFTTDKEVGSARIATFFIGVVNVLAVTAFAFLSDIAGRRLIILIGGTVMTVMNVLVGIGFHYKIDLLSQIAVILFIAGYSFSYGPAVWVFVPEVLPPKGVGAAVAFHWFSSMLVTYSYKYYQQAVGRDWTFWTFAICCFLAVIFSYYFVYETKGQTEMQNRLTYSNDQVKEERLDMLHAFDNKKFGTKH